VENDKILGVEKIVYQGELGEQKIYVLPNAEAVDQVLSQLREGGMSDTLQISMSPHQAGRETKPHDTLLDDMASRLQAISDTSVANSLTYTMKEVEELLGEEYLAIDGEQKVYVLPDNAAVDQLLSNFKSLRTGAITQSQMWRKTDVGGYNQEQSEIIEAMNKRIEQLELLLNLTPGQDTETMDKEKKKSRP